MKPADRKEVNRRVVFLPERRRRVVRLKWLIGFLITKLSVDYIAKLTIRLIVNVARVINTDPTRAPQAGKVSSLANYTRSH